MATLVSQDAQVTIEKAMSFSMEPVLKRYARVYELPMDVVRDHERELKRYLAMCAMREKGNGTYGLRGPVDELWHTFIIFTQLYTEFCSSVAGRYLHHAPTEVSKSDGTEKYSTTLSVYKTIFGEEAPVSVWPQLNDDQFASGSSDCC